MSFNHLRGLVAAALFAASFAAPAVAQDKIVLGFSASTAFSNAFVAANQGIFKKHGLEVEMKLVPNSSTTPAALVADSLQVATPTAPITLQAIEQGLDLVVLAGGNYYAKGIEDVAIMVRPDSPIKTAKDFEGKRVATAGLNALPACSASGCRRTAPTTRRRSSPRRRLRSRSSVLRSGQVDGILAVQPFRVARCWRRMSAAWSTTTSRRLKARRSRAGTSRPASGCRQTRKPPPPSRPRCAEATATAEKDKELIRKANLVYIPFPPEVQAKFPDALSRGRDARRGRQVEQDRA